MSVGDAAGGPAGEVDAADVECCYDTAAASSPILLPSPDVGSNGAIYDYERDVSRYGMHPASLSNQCPPEAASASTAVSQHLCLPRRGFSGGPLAPQSTALPDLVSATPGG